MRVLCTFQHHQDALILLMIHHRFEAQVLCALLRKLAVCMACLRAFGFRSATSTQLEEAIGRTEERIG